MRVDLDGGATQPDRRYVPDAFQMFKLTLSAPLSSMTHMQIRGRREFGILPTIPVGSLAFGESPEWRQLTDDNHPIETLVFCYQELVT